MYELPHRFWCAHPVVAVRGSSVLQAQAPQHERVQFSEVRVRRRLFEDHALLDVEIPVVGDGGLGGIVHVYDPGDLAIDVDLAERVCRDRAHHECFLPLVLHLQELFPKCVLEAGVLVLHENGSGPGTRSVKPLGEPQPLQVVAQDVDDDYLAAMGGRRSQGTRLVAVRRRLPKLVTIHEWWLPKPVAVHEWWRAKLVAVHEWWRAKPVAVRRRRPKPVAVRRRRPNCGQWSRR